MYDARFYVGEADEKEDLAGWYTVVDSKTDNIVAFGQTLIAAQVIMYALAASPRFLTEIDSWLEQDEPNSPEPNIYPPVN